MLRKAVQSSLLILVGGMAVVFIVDRHVSAVRAIHTLKQPIARPTPEPTDIQPSFTGYKGVTIGMSAADAREKLGTPKEKSDGQDYYVFSEKETAQILYDTDHTVKTISVNFMGKIDAAPTPKEVVGTEISAGADGSINKMVQFPKAGYWVSYLRTAGDDPMIVITMQKMAREQ